MKHPNEPDRSKGGTFIRDTAGKLLSHLPPTALKPPAVEPASEGNESSQVDAKAASRSAKVKE